MDLTIGQLKVGARLRLGSYHCDQGQPYAPIYWLKADKKDLFIAEDVLDFIAFDGREPQHARDTNIRYAGNPDYDMSNIAQFVDSEEIDWFEKRHETDEPPVSGRTRNWDTAYASHPGFLNGFEEFEIASLDGVRLPFLFEIIGDRRLPLFARKGVRPKMTPELYRFKTSRRSDFKSSSFCDFWTQDASGSYVVTIGRDGQAEKKMPYDGSGLRPVCRIKADTKVAIDDNGVYIVKPFETEEEGEFCTMDELYHYLGLR